MGIELATNANENKINNRAYNENNFCALVIGILTMSGIAVCLMFQRRNLYIIKHFPTDHSELLIRKEQIDLL